MPDQTARHGSPADELVGQERMDFEDSWVRAQAPIASYSKGEVMERLLEFLNDEA